MIAVSEALKNIEIEDVYEPPLLVEAGEYAEATQGSIGRFPEVSFNWWPF
ncbi:hypothetical protein STRAU_0854 [Streptomyces aurantiacus JA 4570]|uniref:Uncharacterized protein n=1 Tax=Streptomyces aurantiacus JA 4570 TaxID=1286094 RepID=S3ZSJ1_9ACTN|nr:hypothetical protein STRAU_0854 [Streptomyces aurantiacus JA 4570]